MGIFDDFVREEAPRLEPGDYRVEVADVEETTSKSSGSPMLVITLRPNGAKITVRHYIVKNEYFNRNMTEFYDSFDVDFGDQNILSWIGAVGAAKLIEDENGYLKVKRLIHKDKQGSLPPWVGKIPERQKVLLDENGDPDDDLPF